MSLGATIRSMIEDAMLSAYIVSPRFDDYEIVSVEIPPQGLEDAIDDEVKKLAQSGISSNDYDEHVNAFKGEKRSKGGKNDIFKKLGIQNPNEAIDFLSNPKGKVMNTMMGLFKNYAKIIPVIGPVIVAALAIPEVAKKVATMLTARGSYFDMTFRKNLDTMVNRMRTIEQQQSIRSGFTPVIFTSRAGTPFERDSYNTYVEINKRDIKTDKDWSIRDTLGVT